jgi:predicted enzyme related to lactoylglutathione lyase
MASRKSAQLERIAGMLAHTELASTDPERTRQFLAKVFGWRMEEVSTPTGGTLIRYRTPGGTGGSIRRTGPNEVPAAINYVLVKDIEATASKVREKGGEILMPTVDVPQMGRFFWFKVPGGPVLAAWQDAPARVGALRTRARTASRRRPL